MAIETELAVQVSFMYVVVATVSIAILNMYAVEEHDTNLVTRNEGELGIVRAGKVAVYFVLAPIAFVGFLLVGVGEYLFSRGDGE